MNTAPAMANHALTTLCMALLCMTMQPALSRVAHAQSALSTEPHPAAITQPPSEIPLPAPLNASEDAQPLASPPASELEKLLHASPAQDTPSSTAPSLAEEPAPIITTTQPDTTPPTSSSPPAIQSTPLPTLAPTSAHEAENATAEDTAADTRTAYPEPEHYSLPTDSPLPIVGDFIIHPVRGEETLYDIARLYGLGIVELALANPKLDVWLPGVGTEVLVPRSFILPDTPKQGIVINLPELRMYVYTRKKTGHKTYTDVVTYPIGAGREGLNTPIGTTTVVRKKANPIWYPTAQTRKDNPEYPEMVPPGEDNPLGTHALYLGWPTYVIHGTHRPWGVGRRVSRGCIRLYPEHIPLLFAATATGTPVRTVEQPIKFGLQNGSLFVEVHPMDADMESIGAPQPMTEEDKQLLTQRIQAIPQSHSLTIDWERLWAAVENPRGYPILISQ